MTSIGNGLRAACILVVALWVQGCVTSTADRVNPIPSPQSVTQGIQGTLQRYAAFPSRLVPARTVSVWLPERYAESTDRRYPVLYVHDGQMLWDAQKTWNHKSWEVDDVVSQLIAQGKINEVIVVGIDNTPQRFEEYMPYDAVSDAGVRGLPSMPTVAKSSITSDAYLRFIVTELKPFVDSSYRTLKTPENTFMLGSSMGGLISLYAISEYPDVFGGVAAMSTHWPAGDGAMIDYLSRQLPAPGTHRIYMDHGTATLDAEYGTYQIRMDELMRARGYAVNRNWVTKVFPGAAHDETAWNVRLHQPLKFLLGTK